MVISYDKWKKSYESLDAAQKQQYVDAIKNKGADYVGNQYLQQYNSASNSKSTPINTSTSSKNTVTETYRGQVSDGTANMNSMSQTSAKENSRNAQVGTGDVVGMPQQPRASLNVGQNQTSNNAVASRWNQMTAAEQMKALMNNKDLGNYLQSKGLTTKQEPAQTQNQGTAGVSSTAGTAGKTGSANKGTTYSTPKQAEWDYQDNSQARMNQMADNLLGYEKSMPRLFDNWAEFYNFFIKDKGRSQDQIDFLEKYFDDYKKYTPYDSMSPNDVGAGLANGEIPDGYLDFIKGRDPNRYAEIIAYKKEGEDTIKYESYLSEASELAGLGGFRKWNVEEMKYTDKDNDGLDDRLYHAPTEEELMLVKENSEYEAERLKLKNAMKYLQDDLTDQYPEADLSTIMLLTSDRGDKIQRALDTLSVSQTKVQGTLSYLQNERTTMDTAGKNTIAELQKNYGMYYDYSPEGMAERVQAQYAATNVTLDQADSGTETQKQMALQNVLDGYYAKYGDIIQRSEQQVINDVIAYAKKNGVGLAQALQENFVKPLQAKPGFDQLNSISGDPYVVKVGDVAYRYNPATDEFELITGSGTTGGNGGSGAYQFSESEVRTGDTIGNDINSIGHILASDDGLRVGTYKSTNGYTYNVYANRDDGIQATENLLKKSYYGLSLQDAAQKWIGKGKDISAAKKVIEREGLSLSDTLSDSNVRKFIEAMGKWEGTLKNGQSLDEWAQGGKDLSGYASKEQGDTQWLNAKFGNSRGWNNNGYFDDLTTEYKGYLANGKSALSDKQREALKNDYGVDEKLFRMMAQNYARTGMKAEEVGSASNALEAAIKLYEYINGSESEWAGWQNSAQAGLIDRLNSRVGLAGTKANDARGYYDTLMSRLTLDKLIETKKQGATYGAMSEGEWKLLGSAATDLNWTSSGGKFQNNLEDLIYSLYTVVEQGDGGLPTNFTNSSAAKMLYKGEESGRRNKYKEDNTPGDYDNFGQRPQRIS